MTEAPFFKQHPNFIPRLVAGVGIFATIVFASYLVTASGIIQTWAVRGGWWWIGLTFIAGLLYTTFSTIPFATAIFISLAHVPLPIWLTAFIGGIGAMIGDAGLFSALRIGILESAAEYLAEKTHGYFQQMMHKKYVRIVAILVGGLVVASPLPDELGMAIMGMTKLPTRFILLISFGFNFASIAMIMLLAR